MQDWFPHEAEQKRKQNEKEAAQEQLAEALSHKDNSPFFLTVAPIAPHSVWVIEPENNLSYLLAPEVAERHKHLFEDYKIPRDGSFNAGVDGGECVSVVVNTPAGGPLVPGGLGGLRRGPS